MKKIVVVNDFPIYPPNHGGKVRIYNIYKHLSTHYQVTYLCFGDSESVEERVLGDHFLEVRVPKGFIHKKAISAICSLWNIGVDDLVAMLFCRFNGKMMSILKEHVKDSDIVVSALPYMYPSLKESLGSRPLVYDAQNVEYVLKKSILKDGFLKNMLCRVLKKVEGDLVKNANVIFAPSAIDAGQFSDIYRVSTAKIYISPNGTELTAYDTIYKEGMMLKEKIIDKPIALFLGSAHPPNIEAANNIIDNISPRMKEVYFIISGTVGWGIKNRETPNNVGLTFAVSDEEKVELFRIADVALNPMLSGSGTNIKMMDYMAAGLPVIATPVGARGLDIVNNKDAVICDIYEFPNNIRNVLNDHDLYKKLRINGRRLVEEKYDWRNIAQNMRLVLEEMVQRYGHQTTSS